MYIKLYSDGACSGNPGPGGYGCVLSTILPNGQVYEAKHCGGYRLTTNNRMELLGVIVGLTHINGSHDVEIITDSKYVCDAFNKGWIDNWRKSNWKNGNMPNIDLWRTLWNLITMQKSYKFTWIKGHAGHPYNEECDRLAVYARNDLVNLQIDTIYEQTR